MKKIVVAPDSFKGSLTSVQVANSIEKGILSVFPRCKVLKLSISDGGEGFVDSIINFKKGVYREVLVHDALMRPVKAHYGVLEEERTAIIEMASASGLTLLQNEERNPMNTTTYGVGELIKDAVSSGCRRIVLGVGGSATNDCGTGMLQALGFRFLDKCRNELGQGGKILPEIDRIDSTNVLPQLRGLEFIVACDVDNPFYGKEGAAWTFAAQKGASVEMIRILDDGLKHFAEVVEKDMKVDVQIKGAGAAGGLGGACLAFLNAEIVSGIDFVLDMIEFDKHVKDADLVITGEGKMDVQTKRGKAASGVLKRASKWNIATIGIAGGVENYRDLNEMGFLALFSIIPYLMPEKEAMKADIASVNIQNTIEQVMKVFQID